MLTRKQNDAEIFGKNFLRFLSLGNFAHYSSKPCKKENANDVR